MNLKKLYHPGGLMYNRVGIGGPYTCPCGCDDGRKMRPFEWGPEKLGIKGTPGMRAIKELEKKKRELNPPRKKSSSPWKGAKITYSTAIFLTDICTDKDCTRPHYLSIGGPSSDKEDLWHGEEAPATIYTLGSATAVIRANKNGRIKG